MGNEQTQQNISIPPKIKNAINNFKEKLNSIESSKERRSLILECKCDDTQFGNEFNLNQWIHIARYVLENDKNIANIRQKCVPSLIKENEFWKRYFYLLKQQKKEKKEKKEKKKKKKEEKKEKEEEEKEEDDIETFQVLLHKPIIWLYKIPASIWRGRNNKCELWGLRNPLWMGRLRIIALNHGQHLQFQFLEKDGKIFLKSTLIKLELIAMDDNIHQYFDAYGVIDSSRYFIIWIDLPNKTKTIPFGFGIRERQDAFDIRAVVSDQLKIIKRDLNKKLKKKNNNASNNDNDDDDYYEDNVSDDDDDVSEYEWKTDNEYDENNDNNTDDLERKYVEIQSEQGQDKIIKKWMKKIKVNRMKRKNKFKLDDDEMISIGNDKHATILKVNTNTKSNDILPLLPPPPSPPLTPQNELDHIERDENNDKINKVEYNDDDFGEFQSWSKPNDNEVNNEDPECK